MHFFIFEVKQHRKPSIEQIREFDETMRV